MREKFERFDKYMKVKGLNDNQVTIHCGLSQGLLGQARCGKSDLGPKTIDKILNIYQDLSRVWLLTGEGEMLKSSVVNHNVVHGDANNSIVGDNNNVSYAPNKYGDSPEMDRKWAPVVPKALAKAADFDILGHVTKQLTGGSVERLYSGTANIDVWHYIDDDALLPYYRRGDCLGLKAYPKGDLRIIPGEVYAVDTHRDGLIVRILRWDEVGEIQACCTNREEYQDFQIPKSDIIRIYKKVLRFSY